MYKPIFYQSSIIFYIMLQNEKSHSLQKEMLILEGTNLGRKNVKRMSKLKGHDDRLLLKVAQSKTTS